MTGTTAPETRDPHLDAAAMAVHALPPAEAERFARHLADCPTCPAEYAGFTETLARMAVLTEQAPPASLRESVFAAAQATPQLPPVVSAPDAGPSSGPDAAAGADSDAGSAVAPVVPLHRHWYTRPGTLVAAAVVAVALIVGGFVIANRPGDQDPTAAMQSCVAQATDAQLLAPAVGAGGSVRWSPSCGAATVTMPAVPDAPAGMGYQMWVMNGAAAVPMGMVTMADDGAPAPMTFAVPLPATDIGVSVEPAAGSTAPTSDPIWVVHLPS